MELTYIQNEKQFKLKLIEKDTYEVSTLNIAENSEQPTLKTHAHLFDELDENIVEEKRLQLQKQNIPLVNHHSAHLLKSILKKSEVETLNSEDSFSSTTDAGNEISLEQESEDPSLQNEKIELPTAILLTKINLCTIENLVLVVDNFVTLYHSNRKDFARELQFFLVQQLAPKHLKIVFTDVLEKKSLKNSNDPESGEVKIFKQNFLCHGQAKEETYKASEIETKLFNVYNVKNKNFEVLGHNKENHETYFVFNFESVNFLVMTKLKEVPNSLQLSLLRSFSNLLNYQLDQKRKLAPKRSNTRQSSTTAQELQQPQTP